MAAPASARTARLRPLRTPTTLPTTLPKPSSLPSPSPRPLLRSVLGDVLRRARREQRRTLADVAEAARVSVPYLSEVERGRKEVSSEVLAAICDGLRVRLSDVLAESGRELAADQERRARVERLEAIRERRAVTAPAPAPTTTSRARGGDVVCLAA